MKEASWRRGEALPSEIRSPKTAFRTTSQYKSSGLSAAALTVQLRPSYACKVRVALLALLVCFSQM